MLHHLERHIEHMRQKPDHTKKQYALVVSLAITLVIFGVWMSMHTFSLDPEAAAMAKAKSPISALTANAADAFEYVKGYFTSGNKTQYSSDNIEVVGGKN